MRHALHVAAIVVCAMVCIPLLSAEEGGPAPKLNELEALKSRIQTLERELRHERKVSADATEKLARIRQGSDATRELEFSIRVIRLQIETVRAERDVLLKLLAKAGSAELEVVHRGLDSQDDFVQLLLFKGISQMKVLGPKLKAKIKLLASRGNPVNPAVAERARELLRLAAAD